MKEEKISEEKYYELMTEVARLPYRDEFKKVKVKENKLNDFLKEVAEGAVETKEEFIEEGIQRTFTGPLLAIIKEKLLRFAQKHEGHFESKAAQYVLGLIYEGIPLYQNPFFISVFIRSASRSSLADNRKVWDFLYEFMPKKVSEKGPGTIEQPELDDFEKKGYKKQKSGLLIPGKKEEKKKGERKIILPGEE